jgi:hypothetical protein
MRTVLLACAALVLGGCSSSALVDGARTLEPGQKAVSVGMSLQRGTTTVSSGLGVPLPMLEVGLRWGVAQDLDIGMKLYMWGLYTDARYRFAHYKAWDLAIAPGIGGYWLAIPGYQIGTMDLHVPVRAQRDLGKSDRWSLTLEASTIVRETFGRVSSDGFTGDFGQLELFAGGGTRLERWGDRGFWGLSFSTHAQPWWGRAPAWAVGLDFGVRRRVDGPMSSSTNPDGAAIDP